MLRKVSEREWDDIRAQIDAIIDAMIERAGHENYTSPLLRELYNNIYGTYPESAMTPYKRTAYTTLFIFGRFPHKHLRRGAKEGPNRRSDLAPIPLNWLNGMLRALKRLQIVSTHPPFGEDVSTWKPLLTFVYKRVCDKSVISVFPAAPERTLRAKVSPEIQVPPNGSQGGAKAALANANSAPSNPDVQTDASQVDHTDLDPGLCLGREQQIDDLVNAIVSTDNSGAALVLGGPGYGKSTLTRAVASRPEAIARFEERRWLVRLETVHSAGEIIDAIAAKLELRGKINFAAVLSKLNEKPSLLILDNIETPWEAQRDQVEGMLRTLAAQSKLALLVSARGDEPILGLSWRRIVWLEPLAATEAKQVFLLIAQPPRILADDPNLSFFLAEKTGVLGGIPLAITLVATCAAREPDLAVLRERWKRAGITLADRLGSAQDRLSSVVVSIEVSLTSPRVQHEGRNLFSALGQLPAGIARVDGAQLFDEEWELAGSQLRAVGLLSPGNRIDLLPPVRDYAFRFCMPADSAIAAWRNYYLALLQKEGAALGWAGGARALHRLVDEIPNFEAAFPALDQLDDSKFESVIAGFGDVLRFTGLGSIAAFDRVIAAFTHNPKRAAIASFICGIVLSDRREYEAALERYNTALDVFTSEDDAQRGASCLRRIGHIKATQGDFRVAREQYREALRLAIQAQDVIIQANCIRLLGELAVLEGDFEAARKWLADAIAAHEKYDGVLGIAACRKGLGDIDMAQNRLDEAEKNYRAALPLFQSVGARIGEGDCLLALGDIERERTIRQEAEQNYRAALACYRGINHVDGEGRAKQRLADLENMSKLEH